MSNEVLTYVCFLSAVAGICSYKCYVVIGNYFENQRRSKNYATAIKATDEASCKGPHIWDTMTLALSKLDPGKYRICTSCGLIAHEGFPLRLNESGLEVYKNNLIRRAVRQKRWSDALYRKQTEADLIMNKLVKSCVERFSGNLDSDISELQQFFRKSNIELDSMYQNLNAQLEQEDNHG